MNRRSFIKKAEALGLLGVFPFEASAASHQDVDLLQDEGQLIFKPPEITDRLNQGPFTTYGDDATAPDNYIVMVTSPSKKQISSFGMGMVTYMCDEAGPPKAKESELFDALDALAKWPMGDKLYLRVDWRDIQQRSGKLDFPEHWHMTFDLAKKYNKRIGLRIQLMSPVIQGHSVPDFLVHKIPFVKLGKTDQIGIPGKVHYAPRYDDKNFVTAFHELDDLLSDKYNGHELVEYVDTYMYGFWGEGHTWPFAGNPFPDYNTAEKTSVAMFEHQVKNWDKTPLTTNTQPDYSFVGNRKVLDRTIETNNWLRTDTIFIETEQIDALSNRPPWIGATIENGFSNGKNESMKFIGDIPKTEMLISHIKDVSPTYCSLWNWHDLSADNLQRYYDQYPEGINDLSTSIGYRVRPSWIWYYEKDEHPFLILGLVNDGVAGVPGALRIYVTNKEKSFIVGGSLDAGYPLPGKVRQAEIKLPKGVKWQGLRLYARIEVKGVRYPVTWACRQPLNEDGSLSLIHNVEG